MRILLTNDDGYLSPGIRALFSTFSREHDVYLCAPLQQMSASGHSITLFKPLRLISESSRIHAIAGTPADCVKAALFHIYKDIAFDLVVSGINQGPNMGEDIFYSGTVAGAREGALNGIFSIAVSMDSWQGPYFFEKAAITTAGIVKKITPELFTEKLLLNINFPCTEAERGIRVTRLGQRVYRDFITTEIRGSESYITIGGDDPSFSTIQGSDLDAVAENMVSVTPLANDLHDPSTLDKIRYLEK